MYIYIYKCCCFIWWSSFIPSKNIDEVFSYNYMDIMSLRSRSHVKEFMFLTRADHLFIHNYIYIYIYNITSKYYFKTYCNVPDDRLEARSRVL